MKLESNKALKILMRSYFEALDRASADPQQKVAWCTSVGPAEILRAFGYKVYFPENHGALIGVTRKAADYIPRAAAEGYSPNICSYLTSDIGSSLKGESPLTKAYGISGVPKPDLLVASDNQCREVEEWFSFYARKHDAPLYVLRSPKFLDRIDEHHLDYMAREMEHMVATIEDLLNTKLDRDKLSETVDLSARATKAWSQVLETAKARPAPMTFFDGTIHMGPIVLMRGTKACLDYYVALKEELLNCVADKKGALERERHRVYWDGMPIWGRLRKMSETFAEMNTAVVASTYCNSWVFDVFDPSDPVRSMARAYAEIFINRSESVKEDYVAQVCKDFAVDGIVYHDAMTCPYNSNTHFGLPDRVQQKNGLPYIVVEGDLNDLRCFSEEQSLIKIETFVEQLDQ